MAEPVIEQIIAVICSRCAGPHPAFECPLIGLGPVIRAKFATLCVLSTCNVIFTADGPMTQRTKIISLFDMGYMCTGCAVGLMAPYDGLHLPGAPTLEERVATLMEDMPPSIVAVRSASAAVVLALVCVCLACSPSAAHAPQAPRLHVRNLDARCPLGAQQTAAPRVLAARALSRRRLNRSFWESRAAVATKLSMALRVRPSRLCSSTLAFSTARA